MKKDKNITTAFEKAKKNIKSTSVKIANKKRKQIDIQHQKLKTDITNEIKSMLVKEFDKVDLNLDLQTKFNFLTISQWGP